MLKWHYLILVTLHGNDCEQANAGPVKGAASCTHTQLLAHTGMQLACQTINFVPYASIAGSRSKQLSLRLQLYDVTQQHN